MGPSILIPLLILAIAVPVALAWAKKSLKNGAGRDEEPPTAPSARLTSNALRDLPAPPWRVVHEIADSKLGGVDHVLIGPAGVFAVVTLLEPLPAAHDDEPDARLIAAAAITRGKLDDSLARCAMSSDRLVRVYWGVNEAGAPIAIQPLPGVVAVDGRSLATWVATLDEQRLTPAQVDLAWQTIATSIGRPDPLR